MQLSDRRFLFSLPWTKNKNKTLPTTTDTSLFVGNSCTAVYHSEESVMESSPTFEITISGGSLFRACLCVFLCGGCSYMLKCVCAHAPEGCKRPWRIVGDILSLSDLFMTILAPELNFLCLCSKALSCKSSPNTSSFKKPF